VKEVWRIVGLDAILGEYRQFARIVDTDGTLYWGFFSEPETLERVLAGEPFETDLASMDECVERLNRYEGAMPEEVLFLRGVESGGTWMPLGFSFLG